MEDKFRIFLLIILIALVISIYTAIFGSIIFVCSAWLNMFFGLKLLSLEQSLICGLIIFVASRILVILSKAPKKGTA